MSEEEKQFAQFIVDYFNVGIKLDETDFELLIKARKNIEISKKEAEVAVIRTGLMYICWCVGNRFNFDTEIILEGKGRKRDLTQTRHIIYYIANKIYGYSQEYIAGFFSGNTVKGTKNHSTILNGIRTTMNRMDTEPNYKQLIINLIEEIKHGNNHQRPNTNTSTGSIQTSTEQQGNNMPVYGNREIENSNRFFQAESGNSDNPDNIAKNEFAGKLEE